MTSLASTGMATGLLSAGSRTTTAATTQLLPYPVFAGPGADPSWNHDAAHTFLPRRLNKVSSIATTTGSPASTSSATTSFATARPSSSGLHRAREKNQCARSWLQQRARPAPASIPHTVRFPVCARKPQARPQNVRNDGAVNNGARPASSAIRDAGTGSVASTSIGGNPFHRRFHKAPPMLSYLRLFLPYPQITRSVALTRYPDQGVGKVFDGEAGPGDTPVMGGRSADTALVVIMTVPRATCQV